MNLPKLSDEGQSIDTMFDGMNQSFKKDDLNDLFVNVTIGDEGKTKNDKVGCLQGTIKMINVSLEMRY